MLGDPNGGHGFAAGPRGGVGHDIRPKVLCAREGEEIWKTGDGRHAARDVVLVACLFGLPETRANRERDRGEEGRDQFGILTTRHVGVVIGAGDREAGVKRWGELQKDVAVCGEVDVVRVDAAGKGVRRWWESCRC